MLLHFRQFCMPDTREIVLTTFDWNSLPKHEAFMLFPLREGLVMQTRSLMQVCLYLQQIHRVPLPWIQEESKQRKHIIYCLEALSTYTKSFSLDCSCGFTIRASSIYVSFCSFSGLCFCVFSSACLFPTFLKVNCWPNPSSTLFRFLTGHTQVFVLSNDVFVLVEEFCCGGFFCFFFSYDLWRTPLKQAMFNETLCKP